MTDIRKYRWLIIILISYNMFFGGAELLVEFAGTSSYILALACTFAAAILYFFLYSGKTSDILSVGDKLRNVKRVISLFVSVSALLSSVVTVSYSCHNFSQYFLQKSPYAYILFFAMIPVIFSTYGGIKPISRYARIGGITSFVVVGIILLLGIGEYDAKNLYPVLGNMPNNKMFFPISFFSGVLYLVPLCVDEKFNTRNLEKEMAKITLISGVAMSLLCLCYSLYTPFEAIAEKNNLLLDISSSINFNFLFERCEVIVFILWIFITFICSGAYFCLFSQSFTYMASTTDRRAIMGAGAVIVISGALFADKFFLFEKLYMCSLIVGFFVSLFVPVTLFICNLYKRR